MTSVSRINIESDRHGFIAGTRGAVSNDTSSHNDGKSQRDGCSQQTHPTHREYSRRGRQRPASSHWQSQFLDNQDQKKHRAALTQGVPPESICYAPLKLVPQEQAQAAAKCFGSPYATNAGWRPSHHLEPRLATLPTLSISLRIKQHFARSAGHIWEPLCPSFARDVPCLPSQLLTFRPVRCNGKGEMASDGFEPVFPGAILGPRDVSAADWYRFLQDIEVSGRLKGSQQIIAGVAPLTMHMGATGYFVTKAIKKGMARKREPVVLETIETWAERFFLPRGLDVYLRNRTERLTAASVGARIQPLKEEDIDRKEKDKRGKKKNGLTLVISPAPLSFNSDTGVSSPYT